MPLASCAAAYQSSVRRGARPPMRRLDCTAPGRSTSSSGSRGRSGTVGTSAPVPVGLPAAEGLLDLVEGAGRGEVADEHEQAAARHDPAPVQRPQRARRHLGDLVGRGQRAAVGVVAVPTVQPGLVGHHAGLRQRPAQVVAEPPGLALGRRARVRRVGEHLGQQARAGRRARTAATRPRRRARRRRRRRAARRRCAAAPRRARPASGCSCRASSCGTARRSWPGRRRGGSRWAPAAARGPAARSPGGRRPRAGRWAAPARRSRAAAACGAWSERGPAAACARDAGFVGLMRHLRRPGRGGRGRRVSGSRRRRPPARR